MWEPESEEHAYYETECGEAFTLINGTPEDNGMKYCPYCGGRIESVLDKYVFSDRELIMEQWDRWRKYIADGGNSSWPRDAFESLLDYYDEKLGVKRG